MLNLSLVHTVVGGWDTESSKNLMLGMAWPLLSHARHQIYAILLNMLRVSVDDSKRFQGLWDSRTTYGFALAFVGPA